MSMAGAAAARRLEGKTSTGRYFEDFAIGQELVHATPRTLTAGDAALYTALYGTRFAVQSGESFATAIGYPAAPLDDLLVFHTVFGKTVPDISLNAVANLGYADVRFLRPVFPGETLRARSQVIGLKETSNGKTGIVWVRSTGLNGDGQPVLDYVRWVMVRKRDPASPAPEPVVPALADHVPVEALGAAVPALAVEAWDVALSGAPHLWEDFEPGERIDHVDGVTIEEAEHQMATRLYQNTARVHFNHHEQAEGRFGRRLVYGGHVMSMARAISFNGLANAFHVAGINGGRHVAPAFAGDTVYAWSEVLEKASLPGRKDVGALRVRMIATKNRPCADFPREGPDAAYEENVILDLDLWLIIPRRAGAGEGR